MTLKRLIAIGAIVACTAVAWFTLGTAIQLRSSSTESRLGPELARNWGPVLAQDHPTLYYEAPAETNARREIQPEGSDLRVALHYEPKNKGLRWYRTYTVDFSAEYHVKNPTPIPQTIYATFRFPAEDARYDQFALSFGGKQTNKEPVNGTITESLTLEPGAEAPLKVAYRAAGLDKWSYLLTSARRIKNLHLAMTTDFREIDIPSGADSPTSRRQTSNGWELTWDYLDVIGAHALGMAMPGVTQPGAVAGRMTFFAPVSLVFFFAVLVIFSLKLGVNLHPMNYFFLAAGCFAFQLLFSYMVDLVPPLLSFGISAFVSILLVNGYLWRAVGGRFARIALIAQFAFMALFSYSFFFEGLTGITITIGALVTLALLMSATARVDWENTFTAGVPVAKAR